MHNQRALSSQNDVWTHRKPPTGRLTGTAPTVPTAAASSLRTALVESCLMVVRAVLVRRSMVMLGTRWNVCESKSVGKRCEMSCVFSFALIVVSRCLVATKTRSVTTIHLMDGQAPSPVIHTPSQRPYPYHPNAAYPYTQQQPYPSPLPTHPARQLHTPLPYNPSQRPVHPLPNGHSPTFPMTPPYAPYLNGPIQTSPPSSSGSEALPSNQIHIVQTTPLPVMLRSSSTLSTTSTNRPPPLSNGPSPAVEEVIVDMSDQYEMYPPQQAQMRQVGPRTGLDQVQARSVVNATRPNEMDGVPRQMVMPQQIPISNPLSSATAVVRASDSNLWQR